MCLLVYRYTRNFPKNEEFGLVSQLRRSAVSVPSNIAEGYNRKSKKEYVQFLHTSSGSLGELQTQLMFSHDIGYLDDVRYQEMSALSIEVDKMLNRLIETLSSGK